MVDDKLLDEIHAELTRSVHRLADPYSTDGSYAAAIKCSPIGLRAMAATHHLDISLTLDDLGWHFLNFREPQFAKETEAGLRVLGLNKMAGWFAEAAGIVCPLRAEIDACGDYYGCLSKHGHTMRIEELTRKAQAVQPNLEGERHLTRLGRLMRASRPRMFSAVKRLTCNSDRLISIFFYLLHDPLTIVRGW